MIEFIKGTLISKSPSSVIVQIGDVAVRATVSMSTYDDLPGVGAAVHLWTHLQMREDELSLFMFSTSEERRVFLNLISVSGVGPKLATTMLSAARAEVIRQAIAGGDSQRLRAIPRIGAKMAERIVLELKGKLDIGFPESAAISADGKGNEIRQAVEALCSLGFTRGEAEKAVDTAAKRGGQGVEELVKLSLGAV